MKFLAYTILLVFAVTLGPSVGSAVDIENVIGLWLFDKGGGTMVKGYSNYGNDGTIQGSPEWVNGKFGKALKLNGSTDYVLVMNDDSLNSPSETNQLTMLAWANRTEIRGGWEEVISKWKAGAAGSSYRLHVNEGTGNWQTWLRNAADGSNISATGSQGKKDAWVHLAVTYDGSATKIYQDGILVGNGGGGGINASDLDVSIGKRTGDGEHFAGIVDEVAILDAAMTEDEINAVMNEGLGRFFSILAVNPRTCLSTTWAALKQWP